MPCHKPPGPFGFHYDTDSPPEQVGWEDMSQVAHCYSRPPREDQTFPDINNCLTITSTIRIGSNRGAQIFVVDRTKVAKIYDPLYYPPYNEYGNKENVFVNADEDHSRETATFEQLQQSPEVMAVIPNYHGSWTMDMETPLGSSHSEQSTHSRPVRFIIMERLNGDCMIDIDAT